MAANFAVLVYAGGSFSTIAGFFDTAYGLGTFGFNPNGFNPNGMCFGFFVYCFVACPL